MTSKQEACHALVPVLGIVALNYTCEAIAARTRTLTTHVVADQNGKAIGRGRSQDDAWEDALHYLRFLHGAIKRGTR